MKIGDRVYVHGHVDEIRNDCVIIHNNGGYFGTVKSEIVEAQKVEDIVSVIRCKDCKHWLPHEQFGFDEDNGEYHNYCGILVPDDHYYAFTREADDYCSRSERKEE